MQPTGIFIVAFAVIAVVAFISGWWASHLSAPKQTRRLRVRNKRLQRRIKRMAVQLQEAYFAAFRGKTLRLDHLIVGDQFRVVQSYQPLASYQSADSGGNDLFLVIACHGENIRWTTERVVKLDRKLDVKARHPLRVGDIVVVSVRSGGSLESKKEIHLVELGQPLHRDE